MILEDRRELRTLLLRKDCDMPLPPWLFVDGRYVGVANKVVVLHEQSRLRSMLRHAGEVAYEVCGDAWFVVC